MKRFDGKGAVVTGGSRGIGLSVVRRLVAEGAGVTVLDLEPGFPRQEIPPDVWQELDGHVAYESGTVTSREDVRRAIDRTRSEFGSLDVMISHAGVGDVQPFLEIDEQTWRGMFEVNVLGAFLCVQEAARAMVTQRRPGTIVVTASTNASYVESNTAAYNASKGAVVALVRSAALDLASHGIRVNAVNPGMIRTRLTTYVTDDPEYGPEYLKDVPLGRFGETVDVANLITFLASPESAWMTGVDVMIDGGQTLGTWLPVPEEPMMLSPRPPDQA